MSENKSNYKNKPGRVMFVDDDMTVRQIVRESFGRSEAAEAVVVATCGSGQELLDRYNELQPALILLDLHMPNMNGVDFIHAMRELPYAKDTPVIFLTGETRVKMEKQYEDIGVIGVIHKPFDPKTLPDQVFAIWNREGFVGDDGHVLHELMEDETDTDTFKENN